MAGRSSHPGKIKGGNFTVARFFVVSTAYTSTWLAISSNLGFYSTVFGPQSLLQMNLAYFSLSIPLLVVSVFLDPWLERRIGIARTILLRLLVGLVGYGAVTATFPFLPLRLWALLGSSTALGLFHGIAFSASYQLVARFANKNVIALGLGCSASGPLVLALQLALGVGDKPSQAQEVRVYLLITAFIAAGLWASVSLLLRHWDAVEGYEAAAAGGSAAAPLLGRAGSAPPASPLPASLAACSHLEPCEALLTADEGWRLPWSWSEDSLVGLDAHVEEGGHPGDADSEAESPGFRPASSAASLARSRSDPAPGLRPGCSRPALLPVASKARASLATGTPQPAPPPADEPGGGGAGAGAAVVETLRGIWPALAALSINSTIALTLFPFFTWVPSSGLLGERLPRVLFFTRIFADVGGRFLPRLKSLAVGTPRSLVLLALAYLACVPPFFLYMKSPGRWHSDAAAVVYVAAMWVVGGFINTASNMMAPMLVRPALKGTAAGAMAIAYVTTHLLGLVVATGLALALFGKAGIA